MNPAATVGPSGRPQPPLPEDAGAPNGGEEAPLAVHYTAMGVGHRRGDTQRGASISYGHPLSRKASKAARCGQTEGVPGYQKAAHWTTMDGPPDPTEGGVLDGVTTHWERLKFIIKQQPVRQNKNVGTSSRDAPWGGAGSQHTQTPGPNGGSADWEVPLCSILIRTAAILRQLFQPACCVPSVGMNALRDGPTRYPKPCHSNSETTKNARAGNCRTVGARRYQWFVPP